MGRVGDTRISQNSPVEAAKIRQQVRREGRLHSRFAYRNESAGLLDCAGNPLPVKAKARFRVSLVRTMLKVWREPMLDSAQDSGGRIPSNCVINGMVSESQLCGRVVCFSMRKTSRS